MSSKPKPSTRLPAWRARVPTLAAVLVTLALVGLLAGISLHYRTTLMREAQARTTRLSYLLAEQAARTFEAVDFTLRGFGPLLVPARVPSPRDLDALLRKRVSELSFVQDLRILDLDGRVLAASDAKAEGRAADRDGCVAALSAAHADPLAIGCAADDLGMAGQPSIAVARRLEEDGAPARIAVADLDPGYFSRFFRDLNLGSHAVVTLTESRGHVLLASAEPDHRDQAVAPSLVPPTERARLTRLQQASRDKILAVRATEGYPLSILVAIDRQDVDRQWRQTITPAVVLTLALGGLLLLLARSVEQRWAERKQARQRAAVAQKLEAMGQMTAGVAHDFRNILAVMQSAMRLIRRRGPEPELLDEADGTIQRGHAMVDRLLAFSRRADLRVETRDVNDLLRQLEVTLRHVAGTDRTVVLDLGTDLPPCRLDATQFDAALMNLVVNARQATAPSAVITVRSRAAAGGATVAVADTGCGIDEATLKRVFEPFFTTKAEHGTGLGLAQVQALMDNIGGTVTVDSTVGVGTDVTLHLPRGVAVASEAGRAPLLTLDPA